MGAECRAAWPVAAGRAQVSVGGRLAPGGRCGWWWRCARWARGVARAAVEAPAGGEHEVGGDGVGVVGGGAPVGVADGGFLCGPGLAEVGLGGGAVAEVPAHVVEVGLDVDGHGEGGEGVGDGGAVVAVDPEEGGDADDAAGGGAGVDGDGADGELVEVVLGADGGVEGHGGAGGGGGVGVGEHDDGDEGVVAVQLDVVGQGGPVGLGDAVVGRGVGARGVGAAVVGVDRHGRGPQPAAAAGTTAPAAARSTEPRLVALVRPPRSSVLVDSVRSHRRCQRQRKQAGGAERYSGPAMKMTCHPSPPVRRRPRSRVKAAGPSLPLSSPDAASRTTVWSSMSARTTAPSGGYHLTL